MQPVTHWQFQAVPVPDIYLLLGRAGYTLGFGTPIVVRVFDGCSAAEITNDSSS